MRTSATDHTDNTDRTYEIASGLALPDAVAAPQKPSTAEFAEDAERCGLRRELGALCGEMLLSSSF